MEYSHNIIQHFLKAAAEFPEKTALIEGNTSITYNQLLEKVQLRASHFIKKGLKPNDRVLVFVPMGIDLYINVLALFYIGAVAVFLDEWVNKQRLELCCQIAQCKGFIAPFKLRLLALLSKEIRTIPIWLKPKQKTENPISTPKVYPSSINETALITFTTGSTGTPKAANRTHGFLNEQFNALLHEIKPASHDVGLPVLPVVLLMNLGVGCTSVISSFRSAKPEKTDFKSVYDLMVKHKVSRIECSPDFILRLANYIVNNNLKTNCVEKIFTGGAPVFPVQAKQITKGFPKAQFHIVYGSTEAEPVSLITGNDLLSKSEDELNKGLPVGKIYANASVLIIPVDQTKLSFASNNALQTHALPPSQVGEIIVSGHHVLRHYINNPEAEAQHKILIEGICWHRTGDSGFLNEQGELYLCGRANQIITINNQLILPFIIENQLQESGLTTRGTILQKNNLLYLIAEGKPIIKDKLKEWVKSKKLPVDHIVIIQQLPRDKRHFSKIEYSKLAELIQ